MRNLLRILFVILSTSAFGQSSLHVEFSGITEREGNVMLSLRDADGNVLENVIVDIPGSGPIQYTFEGLNSGTYTIACFHDANSNKELDKNFMGVPNEKYGFSNDARGTFGPPDLSDQRFNVDGTTSIRITLK